MAKYKYKAKNAQGEKVSGIQEAETKFAAISELKERGLQLVSIEEISQTTETATEGPSSGQKRSLIPFRRSRVKTGEMALFCRQLSTLLEAGVSLIEALDTISRDMHNLAFKNVLSQITVHVNRGLTFSEAIAKHPQVFFSLFLALIKVAEATGMMSQILDQMAAYMESKDALIRKVKAATTYPIFISLFFFGALNVVIFYLIPRFEDIFSEHQAALPLLTRCIFGACRLAINNLAYELTAFAVLIFLTIKFIGTPKGRAVFDHVKLQMPLFGTLLRRVAVSRMCRTLSILVKNGVPIIESFEIVKVASDNTVVKGALETTKRSLLEGKSIAAGMEQSRLFPHMLISIVRVGEESGSLDKLLAKLADYYDQQVDASVVGIISIIEPLLISLLGLLVFVIVMALYIPIFKISAMAG